MTISRRLRFEVLRRDNHTCRYCGAKAPDVALTIDHVIPDTLGGTDDPSNLVTACAPCNAGKSSVPPDAALVADVNEKALRWVAAIRRAAEIQHADRETQLEQLRQFRAAWDNWTWTDREGVRHTVDLPHDWETSVVRWMRNGLAPEDFDYVIRATMLSRALDEFSYLAGVVRNVLDERASIARDLLEGG